MGSLDVSTLLPRLGHGHPGAATLRGLLADYDEDVITRSELEPRFLELVAGAQLPVPAVNTVICGREVDFLWRAQGLVVETDGYAYHRGRDAFETDRARDADLQAAGLRVIRVTWRQVTQERARTAARLRAALAYRVTSSMS